MTQPTETRSSHVLRVASYNLRIFKDDRAAITRVIRAIDADVLLLQEVPRHPLSGHRLAGFADELGLTWFGGARGRMSTTLMTSLRVDLLEAHHATLPVRIFDEPRGYAMATVRLPGHESLVVASVHLPLRSSERLPHVRAIRAAATAAGRPAVVGGDLNEEPGDAAWTELSDGLAQVSESVPTYPAKAPHKQIDAIFASPLITGRTPGLDLVDADVATASDHRPVVVDLDLSALATD
ncbi:endonuclease/exonuclease/phosphatase family protein [Rudaeicoccus suwonensis]|uniref:Endonuclease/exonuclease/phosphatase family metal-dependent hydrolase n=1 Tax=Rudaeicoccus suwonensis TaxID=657409 RepID=A0A561EBN3_9MICO|nr:endonuclease/exonuclease/phosphatase family protein [Rudaeicoccus suwonensis]TWE13009.1 endonuclease/exonuclease/phosphatase family metal-dependent hydrolase [Rudaeicoccus suwonensis]